MEIKWLVVFIGLMRSHAITYDKSDMPVEVTEYSKSQYYCSPINAYSFFKLLRAIFSMSSKAPVELSNFSRNVEAKLSKDAHTNLKLFLIALKSKNSAELDIK